MLKKKRKREEEDPRRESAFRLRGAEVDSSKITRYKKRKRINENDVTSDVGKQGHHIFKLDSCNDHGQERPRI